MPGFLTFQAIVIACATVAFVSSLRFIRLLLEHRRERTAQIPVKELSIRLDRIESVVEATAIEVERISEANRFMAKLLAERVHPMPLPSKPERVITPH